MRLLSLVGKETLMYEWLSSNTPETTKMRSWKKFNCIVYLRLWLRSKLAKTSIRSWSKANFPGCPICWPTKPVKTPQRWWWRMVAAPWTSGFHCSKINKRGPNSLRICCTRSLKLLDLSTMSDTRTGTWLTQISVLERKAMDDLSSRWLTLASAKSCTRQASTLTSKATWCSAVSYS